MRTRACPRVLPRVTCLLALLLAVICLLHVIARDVQLETTVEKSAVPDDGDLVEVEGRRYYFSRRDQMLDWRSAQLFCRSRGLQLVSLEEHAENERVKQLAAARNLTDDLYFIWLGGVDEAARGEQPSDTSSRPRQLVWSGTGQPLVFTEWHEGEPNRGNRDKFSCLAMWGYGDVVAWGLEECAEMSFFICEQEDATLI